MTDRRAPGGCAQAGALRRSCPARASSPPSGVDQPEDVVVVDLGVPGGDQHATLIGQPGRARRRIAQAHGAQPGARLGRRAVGADAPAAVCDRRPALRPGPRRAAHHRARRGDGRHRPPDSREHVRVAGRAGPGLGARRGGPPPRACVYCVRSARGAPEAIGTRGRLVREEQMVDVLLCDLSQARSASAMAG